MYKRQDITNFIDIRRQSVNFTRDALGLGQLPQRALRLHQRDNRHFVRPDAFGLFQADGHADHVGNLGRIAGNADAAERAAPVLERAHPGLELLIEEKTEGKPDSRWTYPADASLAASPRDWKPGSGLLLKENQLFGWAYTVRGNRRVMALIPVTREFLGDLAPDVCESMIFDMGAQRSVLHPSLPDAPPSHNRFPPAVNQLDFEIRWGAPVIPVHFWEDAGRVENEWLTVRTRPSAILRTIFSQTVDWASGVVPMLFFTVAILFLVAEMIALVIGISMTRTITGEIIFNGGLYRQLDRVPSDFLSQLLHPIPLGFKRMVPHVVQSSDGLVIQYTVVDVDTTITFDPGNSGCTNINIVENLQYLQPSVWLGNRF